MEIKKLMYAIIYLVTLAICSHILSVDGGIFALVDIGLLPLFIVTGFDIEGRLAEHFGFRSNGLMGACIGGGVGNLMTDVIGASLDMTMWPMLGGILLFGTLALGVIYIIRPSKAAEFDWTEENAATFEERILDYEGEQDPYEAANPEFF
jgi:hypothetical protein